MKRKEIEKIEVAKNNGNFYYTGILKTDPEDENWVIVETTRGEKLRFRKEQIMQRREDTKQTPGDDTNGNGKGNKNL